MLTQLKLCGVPLFLTLALITAFWTTSGAYGERLSPLQERGKKIYLTGASSSGKEITAYVGHGAVPLPASGLPCGSCHGPDGLGRPEGGVVPSNITWSHLSKPYGTVGAGGQKRPAYAGESLAMAITAGLDSAGRPLGISMPRYRMASEDLEALVAYLKLMESDLDPGLAQDRIVLGTIVPSAGSMKSLGQAMRAVLEAYFADINEQGGIYGRKIRLQVGEADSRKALLEMSKNMIESEEVFALVGAFTAGVDKEYGDLVEQHEIPLMGPFTLFNQDDSALRRFTFYLHGGLSVQAQALLEFAADKLGSKKPQSAVIHPPGALWEQVARAVEKQASQHRWQTPLRATFTSKRTDTGALVKRMKDAHVEALFFFDGIDELLALGEEAKRIAWKPYLFLSGSLAGDEIFKLPAGFQDKVFLAYAMDPSDQTRAGAAEFSQLQSRHGLAQAHMLAQIATYSAAKVLVEGLKRAGRDLSRGKLIASLEKMYQYETGLTPKLTYNANRRIGALGAHIVAIDLEKQRFRPVSQWVGLDQGRM